MTATTIDSIKLLQFNPNRGLGFDFRRELQFSPDRGLLFNPNRALGFDKDRDLEFGKRGPVFRGIVCPNCQSLVRIVDEDCPECGTRVQSLDALGGSKHMAMQRSKRPESVTPRPAMESRRMEQYPTQTPRQPPTPAQAPQSRRPAPPQRTAPSTAPPQTSTGAQVICPNCALQLPGQTVYCPRCGVNIQQWRSYLTQMSQKRTDSDMYKGRYRPPGR